LEFKAKNYIIKHTKYKKGFTLIELLVVIAIIGTLSTIVLASLNSSRTKAQIAKAKMELSQIVKAIIIAQGESGNYLMAITGSNCSYCAGGYVVGADYRNISDTSALYTRLALSMANLETATNGLVVGFSKIIRDPWGSPYNLDENEGEGGGCGFDILWSNGPDGIRGNSDDIYSTQIPHIKCP